MGFVLLIGAIATIRVINKKPTSKIGKTFHYDLLRFKPLLRILRLKYLRLILQLANVAVFLTIVYLGFAGVQVAPFGSDLWNSSKRGLDESTIGVLMVGLVVTKTAIMLEPWNHFVTWFASAVGLSLDFAANLLFVGLTFAFPLILTFIAVSLIKLFMEKSELPLNYTPPAGFWDIYKIWGYMLVPVALALQISHELDHLLNESMKAVSAIGIWLAPTIPVFQGLAGNNLSASLT